MMQIRDYFLEIVLGVISLFVLILLVAPYVFGYVMQSNYGDRLQALSENTNLSFEVISYKRNWFNTTADLIVKNKQKETLFYINQQIVHGPLYLGLVLKGKSPWVTMLIKGNILFDSNSNELLSELFPANNRVTIDAVMRLNDDVSFLLNFPNVSNSFKNILYNFSTIDLTLGFSSEKNQFIGELNVRDFLMNGESLYEVKGFLLSFSQSVTDVGFSGDAVMSLDALKFKVNENIFNVKQLTSRVKNSKGPSSTGAKLDLKVSSINLFGEKVNSLTFKSDLAGIKYNSISDIFVSLMNKEDLKIDLDVTNYHYDSLKVNRFDFFTGYGVFSSDLVIKKQKFVEDMGSNYFSSKLIDLNVSSTEILFNKIYQLLTMSYKATVFNTSKVVLKTLKNMKYIESNNNRLLFRLRNKDGKFIINDFFVTYDELMNNLSSAVLNK